MPKWEVDFYYCTYITLDILGWLGSLAYSLCDALHDSSRLQNLNLSKAVELCQS